MHCFESHKPSPIWTFSLSPVTPSMMGSQECCIFHLATVVGIQCLCFRLQHVDIYLPCITARLRALCCTPSMCCAGHCPSREALCSSCKGAQCAVCGSPSSQQGPSQAPHSSEELPYWHCCHQTKYCSLTLPTFCSLLLLTNSMLLLVLRLSCGGLLYLC